MKLPRLDASKLRRTAAGCLLSILPHDGVGLGWVSECGGVPVGSVGEGRENWKGHAGQSKGVAGAYWRQLLKFRATSELENAVAGPRLG